MCIDDSSPAWLIESSQFVDSAIAKAFPRRDWRFQSSSTRPWGATAKIGLSDGTVLWLKRNYAANFESTLLLFMRTELRLPVPRVIAADTEVEVDTFLMHSAGTPINSSNKNTGALWIEVLECVGRLQARASSEIDALLACGVTDTRAEHLPRILNKFCCDLKYSNRKLSDDLRTVQCQLMRMCNDASSIGFPDSIQHDDLHLGNVLQDSGSLTIIDWADATIANPLGALLYPVHASRVRGDSSRRTQMLLDAYTAGWQLPIKLKLDSAGFQSALRLASLHRALVWQAVAEHSDHGTLVKDYYATGVPRWLGRFVKGSWILQ